MKLPLIAEHMTVETIRETLKTVKTAILPIGCTEQHGYHLPISTDSLIPESFALDAAKQVPAVLFPVLRYSFSGGFLEGTVQIKPETVYQVVFDLLGSLYHQGFRAVFILSGHGGASHKKAVNRAIEDMTKLHGDFYLALNGEPSPTAAAIAKELAGRTHGTTIETSLLMYLRPDLVNIDRAKWEDRPKMRASFENEVDKFIVRKVNENEADFNSKVMVGIGADPTVASAELGKKIYEERLNNTISMIKRLNELVGGIAL